MVSVLDIEAGRRFLARLRELTPGDWHNLADIARPLRGDSIGAVWRRAELKRPAAGPLGLAVTIQTVAASAALLGEFSSHDKYAFYSGLRERVEANTDYSEQMREFFIAQADAHDIVVAVCPGDHAVHEAVLGALDAVCYSRLRTVDRSRIASQYRYLEPVIPLAEVLDG